ncbi:MAG: phospho-N-acetylmuramoyl-pentapeptide-transferase [Nocardioides sp.]
MRTVLFGGGLALVLSLLGTRVAITAFTRIGAGQPIRDDGPTSHHTKRGTPTMGGLVIILSTVIGYFAAKLITQSEPSASAMLLLFLFVGLGLVGFMDDYLKVSQQNSIGLRGRAKVIGQTVVSLIFGSLALWHALADDRGNLPASTHVSFLRDIQWLALPTVLAMVLFWLIITGTSNAVNLADGLDGLACGASMMVFGAYTLVNIWQNNQSCATAAGATCYEVRDPLDLAVVSAAIMGACFGFLWWNASPAAIIMGDTGSLGLGGALAGLAILTRTELLLLIIGGLFVVITLSVMIQVSFFKASRRFALVRTIFRVGPQHRVFRMTPLQHHFEMLGWEQVTIVIRFWIITGLCVAAGLGVFYAQWVAGA